MSKTISVNGEQKPLNSSTLIELLEENGVDSDKGGVAVALNGEVVPRADWAQTSMNQDDKVEIVHIVRGG
ncbi:MAG: sulfur carrier protein ThiS [Alphaproteobacteria bacterium]